MDLKDIENMIDEYASNKRMKLTNIEKSIDSELRKILEALLKK